MTASTPPPTPALDERPASAKPATGSKSRTTSHPVGRVRALARKLLGRDRDKGKTDDPNIYPLF